jgi:hypothetical protein
MRQRKAAVMETRVSMAEGIWLEPHRHQPGLSIIYPINPVGPRPFHRHAIATIRVATPPEPACWYCARQACQQWLVHELFAAYVIHVAAAGD